MTANARARDTLDFKQEAAGWCEAVNRCPQLRLGFAISAP